MMTQPIRMIRAKAALASLTLVAMLTLCACDESSTGEKLTTPGSTPAIPTTPGSNPLGGGLLKISFDPYSNAQAQHETAMETNIVAHANTLVAGYHIARLTSGGVTNIGWGVSNDGGVTWNHGALPNTTTYVGGTMNLVTDPVVAYDQKHGVWMLSFVGEGAPVNSIYASLSNDDGKTWSNPVTVASGDQPDKSWTACDNFPASPYYGTCYTEYDENTSGAVFMTRSTDGGQNWEAPKATADSFAGIAGQPIVLPKGKVVVPIANSDFTQLLVFYSDDGGSSWSATQQVSTITTSPARAGMRASPNPSVAVDSAGKLYLTWYDCRFEGNNCQSNGMVLSTSTDGVTWTSPARINSFPAASSLDHIFPGIGADPATPGKLGLAFYTISAGTCLTDEASCQIDAYYTSSTDGGVNWSTPAHLGGPMTPDWISTTSRGRLIGDYVGVAFLGGVAFPAFSLALQPTTQPYNQSVYVFPQH